jgi:hypothetical protein
MIEFEVSDRSFAFGITSPGGLVIARMIPIIKLIDLKLQLTILVNHLIKPIPGNL